MVTVEHWKQLVEALVAMTENGIGLKCPWCGATKVREISHGILEVDCGTRISVEPTPEGLNVVTRNSHVLIHNKEEYWPYKPFDCRAAKTSLTPGQKPV